MNDSSELVTENTTLRKWRTISIATPYVQIRAANYCVGVLD
jgi:hypothetical protein